MICYLYDNYRRCKVDWRASIYQRVDGSTTKHGSPVVLRGGGTLDMEKIGRVMKRVIREARKGHVEKLAKQQKDAGTDHARTKNQGERL